MDVAGLRSVQENAHSGGGEQSLAGVFQKANRLLARDYWVGVETESSKLVQSAGLTAKAELAFRTP